MSDFIKLKLAVIILLLIITDVSSQVSDFKNFNFIIGNYYKVTLSNGWETEGEPVSYTHLDVYKRQV